MVNNLSMRAHLGLPIRDVLYFRGKKSSKIIGYTFPPLQCKSAFVA